jgi:hypothetical protein
LNQAINQASSTTTMSSSLNPSVVGSSVTFTARVTPVGNQGTVQFQVDGGAFGAAVALDATGRATLTRTFVAPAGTHTVNVSYSGATNYKPSLSNTFTQTVNP